MRIDIDRGASQSIDTYKSILLHLSTYALYSVIAAAHIDKAFTSFYIYEYRLFELKAIYSLKLAIHPFKIDFCAYTRINILTDYDLHDLKKVCSVKRVSCLCAQFDNLLRTVFYLREIERTHTSVNA